MKYMLLCGLIILSACASTMKVEPVTSVEVRTVEVKRPAPIVPSVDQLKLRPVKWVVITPENIDQQFEAIKSGELVFFALTNEGYQNLALNLSDIRANLDQHQRIIAVYKQQF